MNVAIASYQKKKFYLDLACLTSTKADTWQLLSRVVAGFSILWVNFKMIANQ